MPHSRRSSSCAIVTTRSIAWSWLGAVSGGLVGVSSFTDYGLTPARPRLLPGADRAAMGRARLAAGPWAMGSADVRASGYVIFLCRASRRAPGRPRGSRHCGAATDTAIGYGRAVSRIGHDGVNERDSRNTRFPTKLDVCWSRLRLRHLLASCERRLGRAGDRLRTSIELIVEVEIERPPPEVWSVLSDAERLPEWFAEFEEARQESAGPSGLGTVVRYTLQDRAPLGYFRDRRMGSTTQAGLGRPAAALGRRRGTAARLPRARRGW